MPDRTLHHLPQLSRRTLLLGATAGAATLLASPAQAQITDLSAAIDKAGRQRMLSQRMAKSWLALLHGVEPHSAQRVLDGSMALFDRQLVELKAFAPTQELKATYDKLDASWNDYKAALVGTPPSRQGVSAVLAADARVLALAHQGTQQYEAVSGKPVGKLVNVSGRQRMLSQRLAKFYLAAALPHDRDTALAEMGTARNEFTTAMQLLRGAPEATPRIQEELQLADGQWLFFDAALKRLQSGSPNARALAEVWISSENLLATMEKATGMFAAIRT